MTSPFIVRVALGGYTLAFLCELYVDWLKLVDPQTGTLGQAALIASIVANPLAIWCSWLGRRWARDLLVVIAVASLAWPKFSHDWLIATKPMPLILLTIALLLRFAAVVLLRRPASNSWFETRGSGSGLAGLQSTTKINDTRGRAALKAIAGMVLAIGILCFVPGTPMFGMYFLGISALTLSSILNILSLVRRR